MIVPEVGGTGNVSWNQSFASTLYGAIEFGYNQTLGTEAQFGNFWYNQTLGTQTQFGNFWYNQTLGTFAQHTGTCPGTDKMSGVLANGTINCTADVSSAFDNTNIAYFNNTQTWTLAQILQGLTTVRTMDFQSTAGEAFGDIRGGDSDYVWRIGDTTGANRGSLFVFSENTSEFILNNTNLTVDQLPSCNADGEKLETDAEGRFFCGVAVTGTGNASWNQSFANTLYTPLPFDNTNIAYFNNTQTWSLTQTFTSQIIANGGIQTATIDGIGGTGGTIIIEGDPFGSSGIFLNISETRMEIRDSDLDVLGGGDLLLSGGNINVTTSGNLFIGPTRQYWNGTCFNTEVNGVVIMALGC